MKTKASRVLGIDSSTNSIAWCLFYNRRVEAYGEFTMDGDLDKRLGLIRIKFDDLLDEQQPDFVVIEKAVFINNKDVFGKLSKVVGVLQSCVAARKLRSAEVLPKIWQYDIGNNSWTRRQRADFKRANRGKSASWISAEIRKRRKQFTVDYVQKHYSITAKNDNIADSIGVARYGYYNLTRR